MVYLANRGDDLEMRHLKLNFDLGRSRFVFYSPRDRDSIKEVIADADVVVNLIGKYYESGQPASTDTFPFITYQTNYSFHDTNVEIPATLAEICKELQVDHFVYVSAASASPDSRSEWSRTKYEGEQAVKSIYPWATIIRPTHMFGKEDRFLNGFARMAKWYRQVPLVNEGSALTQPVWVGDVARTILRVVDGGQEAFAGRTVDCFGPTEYSYAELAEFVGDITERQRPIRQVPYSWLRNIARVLQYQRNPLLTPDLVDQWSQDCLPPLKTLAAYQAQAEDSPDKVLCMQDLGIEPMSIQKDAFGYLQQYQFGGHFHRVSGYH